MKGYKVIVGLIALGFAAGMFGGYRIWGPMKKGETDVRQLLQQVNDEVARIESKNKELTASLESSREAVNASEALRKENQDLKDQLKVAYQEKQELESTMEEVRAKERDAANQSEDSKKLESTIDELKARISALESENRELKSVIDNVSEMTRRKEVTGR
jgi:chromosome segregation ATPase